MNLIKWLGYPGEDCDGPRGWGTDWFQEVSPIYLKKQNEGFILCVKRGTHKQFLDGSFRPMKSSPRQSPNHHSQEHYHRVRESDQDSLSPSHFSDPEDWDGRTVEADNICTALYMPSDMLCKTVNGEVFVSKPASRSDNLTEWIKWPSLMDEPVHSGIGSGRWETFASSLREAVFIVNLAWQPQYLQSRRGGGTTLRAVSICCVQI